MKLVIVESPSKCNMIEKYLGKDYKVIASCGHFRSLHKLEQINVETLDIKYSINKPKIVKQLNFTKNLIVLLNVKNVRINLKYFALNVSTMIIS